MRHVREAVRFADGIGVLAGEGVTRFLEIGPDGTLTALARAVAEEGGDEALFVATLRKARDESRATVAAMAALRAMAKFHVDGADIDWPAVLGGGTGGEPVDLPTYPFQRQRYWLTPSQPPPGGPSGPTRASVVVDAEFWASVASEDVPTLAAVAAREANPSTCRRTRSSGSAIGSPRANRRPAARRVRRELPL
ncbi:hypothetical protein, partial [Streptomyces sp. LUP30]|uniref:hypothetical protein n=1 Tax=Streptomyces sp. LUP30 TaxID=1890285 RepID=UPI001C408963